MNNAISSDRICNIQAALLDMPIGPTGVRFGVVVTRWGKDCFETETYARGDMVGSESAAERIAELTA